MKTLQANTEVIYRFRCSRCSSLFEMTEAERYENDWECGEHKKGGKYDYPHNPVNNFKCPICKCVRTMDSRSLHKYMLMNDGSEYMQY